MLNIAHHFANTGGMDWEGGRKGGREGREEERQGGKVRERRKGERLIDQFPPKDCTHNLGMCPNWELYPQPFDIWDDNPTN